MSTDERARFFRDTIARIASSFEKQFQEGQRRLSFAEYLDLFASDPRRYARDAGTYVRDMFDYYGTTQVETAVGMKTRWKVFDIPWETPEVALASRLVGQEDVQAEVYRELSNFARRGRPNRLLLLHGPNGSSKSTLVSCIMQGLEHYSHQPEGALYRFHWVFPNEKRLRGSIGFGASKESREEIGGESYAHLPDEQIDARLFIEVRDHPLFLIPLEERRKLLLELWSKAGLEGHPPVWLMTGQLAHKNQQVMDALLSKYNGSLSEVLRHVLVERFFISRQYRIGAVTVGPQMSVDASERQLTADQNLAALPVALQSVPLFEVFGELVDAAGGVLEFSDLLKRPLESFKYLQISVETGEVSLTRQNLRLNCVMVGSANDVHLEAFRNIAEFPSYRGRMSFIRTPYLLDYHQEQAIYDGQVLPQVQRHVAPHASEALALFAVLTRMVPPSEEFYGEEPLRKAATSLTAIEKADLYATGAVPSRLSADEQAWLKSHLELVYRDGAERREYEGRLGASPREMISALLDAAQDPHHACLSPLAVLEQLETLSRQTSQYEWAGRKPVSGGYFDNAAFLREVRRRLEDHWEKEIRQASGLVDEAQYADMFQRYVQHVSAWSKNERIHNRITDTYEKPDEVLMGEVEKWLGWDDDPEGNRRRMLSKLAAWALEHPDEPLEHGRLFEQDMEKLRRAVYQKLRKPLAELARDIVTLVREEAHGLEEKRKQEVRDALDRMAAQFGYCDQCAADAAAQLVATRFREELE